MNASSRYWSLRQDSTQESNIIYPVKKNPNMESLNFQLKNYLTSNQVIT